MAITGIDTIDGKQIIAAGASSAVKAAQDGDGNIITATYYPASSKNVLYGMNNVIYPSMYNNYNYLFGYENSGNGFSIAGAYMCSAGNNSEAFGYCSYAYNNSLAVNQGSATNGSTALGEGTSANGKGLAIGRYNKNTSAAFVIGEGEDNNSRTDIFIINHDGSMSASGNISANGYEMKPIAIVTTTAQATANGVIYFVTGS